MWYSKAALLVLSGQWTHDAKHHWQHSNYKQSEAARAAFFFCPDPAESERVIQPEPIGPTQFMRAEALCATLSCSCYHGYSWPFYPDCRRVQCRWQWKGIVLCTYTYKHLCNFKWINLTQISLLNSTWLWVGYPCSNFLMSEFINFIPAILRGGV